MKRYLVNILVGIDILVNALLWGSPYETLSERAWRWKQGGRRTGTLLVTVIDGIFGAGHCANAGEGREGQYDLIDPVEGK